MYLFVVCDQKVYKIQNIRLSLSSGEFKKVSNEAGDEHLQVFSTCLDVIFVGTFVGTFIVNNV